jgi:hypothetical protein
MKKEIFFYDIINCALLYAGTLKNSKNISQGKNIMKTEKNSLNISIAVRRSPFAVRRYL